MSIEIQGIIKGMCDMGCNLVKIEENKLYFEIPHTFTARQLQLSKEIINHYGYRLFTKRV